MISALIGKIAGEKTLRVPKDGLVGFYNVLRESGEWIYSEKQTDGYMTCMARPGIADRLKILCEAEGIELTVSRLEGIPGILYRYRRRYGAFLGALILICSAFFSRYFIWDFKVVGNDTVPADEILAGLDKLGIRSGAYIPSIDFEMAANDFLLESDDIAWISVNMRSSLAVVEVLERKKADPRTEVPEGVYANMIAAEDAEIVLPEISSGRTKVAPGTVVRKGELLATGVMTVREDGVRYEYASGEVLGKVYREINVTVPLSTERKTYTGEQKTRKSVKIFGKIKNLFRNSSIDYAKYDKIEEEKQLCFFDTVTVPVWIKTTTCNEYVTEPYIRTESEAKTEAEKEFTDEVRALLDEGEIVSMETDSHADADAYRITSKVYMVKNIAELSEFKLTEVKNDTENTDRGEH